MKHKKGIFLSIALSVSGCTWITDTVVKSHGYTPKREEISSILNASITQQQFISEHGKPVITGVYNPNYWYYISYRTEQYGFKNPQLIDFKMIEVYFKNNRVADIKTYNADQLRKITFNDKVTKTSGQKLGVLEQIISNVGRFRTKEKSF